MPTYNILAIDGGGLRGIIPVRILQKVEEVAKRPIHEIFDLMSGTSTGGLIVSCLTLRDKSNPAKPQYSLEEIANMYVTRGKDIFPVRTGIGKFFNRMKQLVDPRF